MFPNSPSAMPRILPVWRAGWGGEVERGGGGVEKHIDEFPEMESLLRGGGGEEGGARPGINPITLMK